MRVTPGRTAFFVGLIFAPFFACFEEQGPAPSAAASEAVAQSAVVKGVVVDKKTKLPVKGAVVSTVPATLDVVTDDEGRFRLAQGLDADAEYTLIATATGYGDVQIPVEPAPGEVILVPVALEKAEEVPGEAVSLTSPLP